MREFHFDTAAAFAAFIRRHVDMTKRREAQLYTRVVNHAERSMRFGSRTTGAPGQPFRTGNLRDDAFYREGSVAGRNVAMGFDLNIAPYAPIIEHQLGDIELRSEVGGFHSIKLTTNNFSRILREELAYVKAAINIAK